MINLTLISSQFRSPKTPSPLALNNPVSARRLQVVWSHKLTRFAAARAHRAAWGGLKREVGDVDSTSRASIVRPSQPPTNLPLCPLCPQTLRNSFLVTGVSNKDTVRSMESLRATVSGRPAAAIVQMRDPETTRSALIPANSRVRPHDEASDGRAPNRSPTSPNGALHLLPQSLPNSQESNDSFASFVSSVGPRFYASSSNLSQATDLTVPSPVASFERSTQLEGQKEMSRVLPAPQMSSADWRPIPAGFPVTPFIDTNVDGAIRNGASNDTSPTSRTSPASLGGTKRTSSGTVKRPESTHGVLSEWQRGHSRTNSAQSNGSRTGGVREPFLR